jgi:hypothetical protein
MQIRIGIKSISIYRDGGTIEIQTNIGTFCFDKRIGTKTKYALFSNYPLKDNSNLIKDADTINILISLLRDYKSKSCQYEIDEILMFYENK